MPSVTINKYIASITLLVSTGLAFTAVASQAQAPVSPDGRRPVQPLQVKAQQEATVPTQVDGELVVRLAPGANAEAVAAACGGKLKRQLHYAPNTYVFTGISRPLDATVAALNQTPGVVRAAKHSLMRPQTLPQVVPNDPLLQQQTALRQIGAQNVWGITVGERLRNGPRRNVVVGLIDGGFETSHFDLYENFLSTGYDFILDQAYDEFDFNVNLTLDNHGTQVAGCVAAMNNNLEGIASLPWEGVSMLPCRTNVAIQIPNSNPAQFISRLSSAAVVDAIYYCIQEQVDVINISGTLQNANTTDFLMEQAILDAYNEGIVVVAPVGDTSLFGTSGFVQFPATIPQVISVGAVGPSNEHAFYSNVGFELDLVAPGGNDSNGFDPSRQIVVTDSYSFGSLTLPFGYSIGQGTSLASGYVSGAIATLMTQFPENESLTPTEQVDQIADLLTSTARNPFGQFQTIEFGAGILNAEAALKAITQYVDLTSPSQTEVTASFSEPLQARIVKPIAEPLLDGDFEVYQFPLPADVDPNNEVTDLVKITDPDFGSIEYSPTAETVYRIGINSFDVVTHNPLDLDPDGDRTLVGPAVGRIPERSYRFRVTPRVEQAGLKMFSIPYQLDEEAETLQFLFGGNLVRTARYLPDQGRYAIYDIVGSPQDEEASLTTDDAGVATPPVGVGYFARVVNQTQVQLLGRSVRSGFYRIPLKPGFNMIGNPFPFRVPFNVINVQYGNEVMSIAEAARRNLMRPTIWRFEDGRYTFKALPNGELVDWEAHWIRSFQNLTLIVPRVATVLGQNSGAFSNVAAAPSQKGWTATLRATANGQPAGEVTVGVGKAAKNGYGVEDVENPPAAAGVPSIQVRNRSWGAYSGGYLQDIRSDKSGTQQWVVEVETSQPSTNVKLAWDRFPVGSRAQLKVDGKPGVCQLTKDGSISFTAAAAGVHRVTVTAVPGKA